MLFSRQGEAKRLAELIRFKEMQKLFISCRHGRWLNLGVDMKDRISACNVSAFAGREQIQAAQIVQQSQFNAGKTVSQQFLHGNRSGHNKNNPGRYLNTEHKTRYRPLEKSKTRIHENYFNAFLYDFGKTSYNKNKTNKSGSFKRLRSESRHVVKIVSECIAHHVNLQHMLFGFINPKTGQVISFGIDYIFKSVNVSLKDQLVAPISYRRIRSAVSYLASHGYLSVKENKKLQHDNTWRSNPATIHVSRTLFHDLGITDDEINKCLKKDQIVINRELIQRKSTDYKCKERAEKREDKKTRVQVYKLIAKHKDGLKLTEDEKSYLNEESPGYDRIRIESRQPMYRDYTGLRDNKEQVLKRNAEPSETAKSFLSEILNKLKPPS